MAKHSMILQKLEGIKRRYEEVEQLITQPEIIADMDRYVKLNKEYKELESVVEAYNEYKNILDNIESSKDILANEKEEEMKEMAKHELDELNAKVEPLEQKIKFLLLPKDPDDDK
ncbi:MAG: PCRF domain-containing protein, partial [Bacteroidota bacterium]